MTIKTGDAIGEEEIAKAIAAVAERATAVTDGEEGEAEAASSEEHEEDADA